MKKLFALMLIPMLMFISACGDSTEEKPVSEEVFTFDSTDIKTERIDEGQFSNLNLEYKLEKGKIYKFRLTSISEDVQSLKADTTLTQKVVQTLTYIVSVETKNIEDDKTIEADITFNSVNLDADANGKKHKYHTGQKLDSLEREGFLEYEAIIGNPFSARISHKGEILEIFRADKITNKLLELRGYLDSVSAEDKKLFQQDIVEGALKPIVHQIFRKLPDNNVAKDSNWSIVQPPINLQVFAFENIHTFQIAGFEKFDGNNLVVIDAGLKSKTILSDDAKKNNIEITDTKYTAGGKLHFNIDKGLFQKTKTNIYLNVNMSAMAPTPTGGVQKITRIQKTKNTNILEYLKD